MDQRPVTVAQRMGDDVVIGKGLKPGETIVTEGQLRLEQGTRVQSSDAERQRPGRRPRRRGGRGGRGQGQGGSAIRRDRAARRPPSGRPQRAHSVNISETFIRRPIATSLLMAAIALFGVVAYRALPVSDLPTVDYPTINVGANLPGGDPATMASAVASPLERQFTTIAGIDEMTSSSGTGSSNITLTFDLNRNIDSAAVDVQTAISAAMPLLPPTLTAPPSFRKVNPADQPILQHQPHVGHARHDEGRRVRGGHPRPAHLDGERRLAGQRAGRRQVRRARPGRSEQARGPADRHQRNRHGAAELERDAADRTVVRAADHVQHRRARGS